MDDKRWIFIFAAVSGLGGLVSFLSYFGLTFEVLTNHLTLPAPYSLWWLAFGIFLFAVSIVASSYGMFGRPKTPGKKVVDGDGDPTPKLPAPGSRSALPSKEESKTVPASKSPKDIDRETSASLQERLPSDGAIAQLRYLSFQPRFIWEVDLALRTFIVGDSGPEHGFLDEELESIRSALHEEVILLLDRVLRYTDEVSGSDNLRRFWFNKDHEQLAAFDGRREEVIQLSRRICETYDQLVLTARRKI